MQRVVSLRGSAWLLVLAYPRHSGPGMHGSGLNFDFELAQPLQLGQIGVVVVVVIVAFRLVVVVVVVALVLTLVPALVLFR